MTKNLYVLLHCSLFALMVGPANATGTYYNYNGTVQRNYTSSANPFFNYGTNNTYGRQSCQGNGNCANVASNNNQQKNVKTVTRKKANGVVNTTKTGFSWNAGLSHQFASWEFEMDNAGSKLHYDNLHWNVLDANAKYNFYWGNTLAQLSGGVQYGMQFGDSPMIDDDITTGGYLIQAWNVDLDNDNISDAVWSQRGQALSVGTSNGGDMFGVFAGLGMVDVWHIGSFRVTPSFGYRYFKYKLETKQNYGMSIDTVTGADNYCQTIGGETQCLPFVVFLDSDGNPALGTVGTNYIITIPSGTQYLETENTYYYYQNGISHSYDVEWSGPYFALDMLYDITADDSINGHLELGLPMYNATADQPYRADWQHPKSIEDKGGFGDAYHLGFGANWLHSLTDSIMLSVGMTFDYYNASGVDATTYLNSSYYTAAYYDPAVSSNTTLATAYGSTDYQNWSTISGHDLATDKALYAYNLETINAIEQLQASGWKQTDSDEIKSLYKSLGIRVGLQAKF